MFFGGPVARGPFPDARVSGAHVISGVSGACVFIGFCGVIGAAVVVKVAPGYK